jgi:photosystem II stability/assembly factor-like uncharacterized protein
MIRITLIFIALAGRLFAASAPLPSSDARISWEADLRVKRAERIFPSPHDAGRIWVVTPPGIMETRDGGANWNLLPDTGREKLGRISDVLFSPVSAEIILLSSRDNGVFRSNDNGKTWQNIGTAATGVNSPNVSRLACNPADRGAHIYYATHGDAAPGISKTIDGGQTWFTIAENYNVHEILVDGRDVVIGEHPVDEEDAWSITESRDQGATWTEVRPNVHPTVAGVNRIASNYIWFGTLKGRLYERHRTGRWQTGDWQPAGPEDGGEWASIFGAFGTRLDDDVVYAYDPHHYGLIASRDGFKTWWSENTNLYVGPMVKEGANICANSSGQTLFASINGQLYVGRTPVPDGPALTEFKITPSVIHWTKGAPVTVSTKVASFDADPKSKITAVHTNIEALHGPNNFPLFDDGKHEDGAAGDGLFAAPFAVDDEWTRQWQWYDGVKRPHFPGQLMLSVSATDASNRTVTQVFPVSLFAKPQSFIWWNGDDVKRGDKMADGRRATEPAKFDDRHGNIFDMDVEARSGKHCLHIVAFHPGWLTGWGREWEPINISDMDYLSFWIKAPENSTRDLKVLLADAPGGENDASHSSAVSLIKEGYIKELTTEYQQVRIPISKLMKKTGFNIDLVGGIVFGGDDPKGNNFYVDDICFEVEGQPIK